jgi:hypothetical protein
VQAVTVDTNDVLKHPGSNFWAANRTAILVGIGALTNVVGYVPTNDVSVTNARPWDNPDYNAITNPPTIPSTNGLASTNWVIAQGYSTNAGGSGTFDHAALTNQQGNVAYQHITTAQVALVNSALQPGAAGTWTNLSDYNNDIPGSSSNLSAYNNDVPFVTGTVVRSESDPAFTNWASTNTLQSQINSKVGTNDAVYTNAVALAGNAVQRNGETNTLDFTNTHVHVMSPENGIDAASADWVRGLLLIGNPVYVGSNTEVVGYSPFVAQQGVTVLFTNTITSSSVTITGINQYVHSMISTQTFSGTLMGPASVELYCLRKGSGGNQSLNVGMELYYTYDKTNLLGDWATSAGQSVGETVGKIMYTVAFPNTEVTNAYLVYRIKVTALNNTTNLTVYGGQIYPSMAMLRQPSTETMGVRGATNVVYPSGGTGTYDIVNRILTLPAITAEQVGAVATNGDAVNLTNFPASVVLTNNAKLLAALTNVVVNNVTGTVAAGVANVTITDGSSLTGVNATNSTHLGGIPAASYLTNEIYLGTITGATIADGAATGVTTNGEVLEIIVVSNTPEQYLGTITGATVSESTNASSVITNGGVLEFNIRTNTGGTGTGLDTNASYTFATGTTQSLDVLLLSDTGGVRQAVTAMQDPASDDTPYGRSNGAWAALSIPVIGTDAGQAYDGANGVASSNLAYTASTNAEAARQIATNTEATANAALPKSSTNSLVVTELQVTGTNTIANGTNVLVPPYKGSLNGTNGMFWTQDATNYWMLFIP